MNALIIFIIGLPILEVFLMIKIGQVIGATTTIACIILTAVSGVYFAKLQGLSAIKSGIPQLLRNEIPIYELVSGAALAFASILLIFPGFITDFLGFLLIIPFTRKLLFSLMANKFTTKKAGGKKDFIEVDYEDIQDKD